MCLQRLHLQQYDPILNQIINGIYLTNRPQFSMVYTLIDHINDVIKCSKTQVESRAIRDMLRHFHGLYSHRP